jgi:hypothetical protein
MSSNLLNKNLPSASAGPSRPAVDPGYGHGFGSLQPPAISHLKRISASLNDPDDWANTSPSMLDWIRHQALDTPIEEHPERPFPVPADGARDSTGVSPMLSNIQHTGGLGIDIHQDPYAPSKSDASQPPPDMYRDDFETQGLRLDSTTRKPRSAVSVGTAPRRIPAQQSLRVWISPQCPLPNPPNLPSIRRSKSD